MHAILSTEAGWFLVEGEQEEVTKLLAGELLPGQPTTATMTLISPDMLAKHFPELVREET